MSKGLEQGLITFDDDLRLMLSPRLKKEMRQRAVAENFGAYAGEALCLPDDATPPDPAFLVGHRAGVFRGAVECGGLPPL